MKSMRVLNRDRMLFGVSYPAFIPLAAIFFTATLFRHAIAGFIVSITLGIFIRIVEAKKPRGFMLSFIIHPFQRRRFYYAYKKSIFKRNS